MSYIVLILVFFVIWLLEEHSHKQKYNTLDSELKELKKVFGNTISDNKQLIIAYYRHLGTSVDDLSLNSKICNPSDLAYVQKPYENRKLLQLPNNKFQIVRLNEEGLVQGAVDLGVVDTLEEVKTFIKSTNYIILN